MMHQYGDPNHNGQGMNNWWALTPDANGSYLNGTWSQLASMSSSYGPLYFASAVLLDGRLGEREREILFVALAESADALGVLGDAAAALRDLARAGDIPADLPTPDRVPPDGS